METAVQHIQTLDIGSLIAIGVMMIGVCGIMCKVMMIGFGHMNSRLDKMQETITDIDRRLCRLEGAFQSKECCLLKSDTQHKVAE